MLRLQGKVTRAFEPRPYTLDDGTKGISRKFACLPVTEDDVYVITLREGQGDVRKGDLVDLAVTPSVQGGALKLRCEGPWAEFADDVYDVPA